MRLKAIQEVWYAGRARHPGDEFDCDDGDFCRILSASDLPGGQKVMKVESLPPAPVEATPEPPLVEQSVENLFDKQAEAEESNDKPVSRRRFYKRRDMRAEE